MRPFAKHGACAVLALSASACAQSTDLPMIFVQTTSVGITINGGATQQSAELTVGYRDMDAAIVPVSVTQANGSRTNLLPHVKHQTATGSDDDADALSVLGQFQVNAASAAPQVGLGKFFATGQAAKRLSDGFAHKLGGWPPSGTTPPATKTP